MTPAAHRTCLAGLLLATTLAFTACGKDGNSSATPDATPGPADARPVPESITAFMAAVPGLEYAPSNTDYPGYKAYLLFYTQPLDHNDPDGATFTQRMVLHHIDRHAPTVLYTSGYSLFTIDYISELGVAMASNHISTEQRFFSSSRPSPLATGDWQHLTIEQAAADHHRIVDAFAPYYDGTWLNTGHSKGGMTSVYHRRFYPDDVDATVAYVTPISFDHPDPRYEAIFDTVGDKACRDAMSTMQVTALERFTALLALAASEAESVGATFDRSGGQAAAFEGDIAGMHWSFWQFYGWDYCDQIPAADATDDALFSFINTVGGIGSDDSSIGDFEPYYYQAAVELGFPSLPTAHLDNLLAYANVEGDYLPADVPAVYDDAAAMSDIADWVKGTDASLMFIYGEYDPWSGGMFELGDATNAHRFVAARAAHNANIRRLSSTDQDSALSIIGGWMGVQPSLSSASGRLLRDAPVVSKAHAPRRVQRARSF